MQFHVSLALAVHIVWLGACGDDTSAGADAQMHETHTHDAQAGRPAGESGESGGKAGSQSGGNGPAGSAAPTVDAGIDSAGAPGNVVVVPNGAGAVVDCVTAPKESTCVSASGVRNGMAFFCYTDNPLATRSPSVTTGPASWAFGCDDSASGVSIAVSFPVQGEGPITATPGAKGLKYSVGSVEPSAGLKAGAMSESARNLVSGMLKAQLQAGPRAIGTLSSSWSKPAGGCDSGHLDDPCAEGSVHITFNLKLP